MGSTPFLKIASSNRCLIIPQREAQLEQETYNRILDLEARVGAQERVIERYQNEDSETGVITEVCTEASSTPSSEAATVNKARFKGRVKTAARAVRKERAKL